MRTWPTALAAEIASSSPNLALLVRLDRADGTALGFCSTDARLTAMGLDYVPDEGVAISAAKMGIGQEVDGATFDGSIEVSRLGTQDVRTRSLAGARLTLMVCPVASPSSFGILARYEVGEASVAGGRFKVEARGATARLRQEVGDKFGKTCPCRRLGDARCKVALSGNVRGYAITQTLSVRDDGETTDRILSLDGGPPLDDFFTFGTAEHQGVRRDVRSSTYLGGVTRVTLRDPLPSVPTNDNEVILVAGCNRKLLYERDATAEPRVGSTCTEFGNAVNYRGFFDLPGNDATLAAASKEGA